MELRGEVGDRLALMLVNSTQLTKVHVCTTAQTTHPAAMSQIILPYLSFAASLNSCLLLSVRTEYK